MSKVQERKQEMELLYDLQPNVLEIMRSKEQWSRLLREMVRVELHISRWSGRCALELSDLGLSPQDASALVRLGHRRLLPVIPEDSPFYDEKDKDRTYVDLLIAAEKYARDQLDKYRIWTPFGYVLTPERYKEWRSSNAVAEQHIRSVVAEIVARWDELLALTLNEYDDLARKAWLRRQKLMSEDELSAAGQAQIDAFVSEFLRRVKASIPPVEKFQAFRYDVRLTYLPLQDALAEEEADAERADAKRELERREEAIRARELTGREQIIAEVWAEVREQAREDIKKAVSQVTRALCSQVRERIVAVAKNLLDAMNRNDGKLPPKSKGSIGNLFEWIDSMTITLNLDKDKEVQALMAGFKKIQSGKPADLAQILNDIETVATISVMSLRDGYERGLDEREIYTVTTPVNLRGSRERLGLETKLVLSEPLQRGEGRES